MASGMGIERERNADPGGPRRCMITEASEWTGSAKGSVSQGRDSLLRAGPYPGIQCQDVLQR